MQRLVAAESKLMGGYFDLCEVLAELHTHVPTVKFEAWYTHRGYTKRFVCAAMKFAALENAVHTSTQTHYIVCLLLCFIC